MDSTIGITANPLDDLAMTGNENTYTQTNGTRTNGIHGNGHVHANGTQTNGIDSSGSGHSNGTHPRAVSKPEPIAICGIGLRLPGGIRTQEAFWDVMYHGKDMRRPIPSERFNIDAFGTSLGKKGVIKPRHGYFLDEDLACLDAGFFAMSKVELEKTDPQQRQLLEVTRECLENAGEVDYRGKPIGCYIGTFGDDWMESQAKENQFTGGYNFGIGNDLMIANRISFEYDFKGPSMVVKTGCSAALVALHEACRSLQNRDCDAALVAGSSLLMGPTTFAAMSSENILSPEGSCKTFDAAADGFARGEAINAVFLKRLDDAIADKSPIRAVIRNSGTNCDGRSPSIMTPNPAVQEALIRKVYKDSGLEPSETAFIECHGTGTPTGDPIETNAIGNVFGERGIYIGSVKPNVGHSEGASGLTSLIKAVLSLEKHIILPNIKFSTPNPKIQFAEKKLTVPVKPTAWPEDRAARISVNSFGIGGSNAHVIVESAASYLPELAPSHIPERKVIPQLLVYSANSEESAQRLGDQYLDYIRDHPETVTDLAYTLSQRREKLPYRGFITVRPGTPPSNASPSVKAPLKTPSSVMVFSGQGAQWPQMGKNLLESCPWLRVDFAAMDEVLQSLKYPPDWSIQEELVKPAEESQIHRAHLSQPLCTAIQIALVNSLAHAGISPEAVVGHSSGEIAAAYAVGALSLREAMIISYYRGLATQERENLGGMAAIGLSASAVAEFLTEGVVVAAENSPHSTTISGDLKKLEQVVARVKLEKPDVLARRLQVDMAYHSHHMVPIADTYLGMLVDELDAANISNQAFRGSMFSTVSGTAVDEPLDFAYWVSNMISPVKFYPAVKTLLRTLPQCMFLEIGPHSQLAGPLRDIYAEARATYTYIPTMIRSSNATDTLLRALGQVFQQGGDVNLAPLTVGGRVLTDLPPYPWDHSARYWFENRISRDWRFRQFGHHALLGQRIAESTSLEPAWRVVIDLEDEAWLYDHKIRNDVVFPFTGYISMAGEAVRQVSGINTGYSIRHMVVHTALLLNETKPVEMVTTLRRRKLTDSVDSEYFDFTIMSLSGSTWIKQCDGSVKPCSEDATPRPSSCTSFPRKVNAKRWYDIMARGGMIYGPEFQAMKTLDASTTEARARASIAGKRSAPFIFHPTSMDACLQVAIAARAQGVPRNLKQVLVPTMVDQLDVFHTADSLVAEAWTRSDENILDLDCTGDDRVALRLRGLHVTPVDEDGDTPARSFDRHAAARLEWFPDFDFMDWPSLFAAPEIPTRLKTILEEVVLLCILESAERVESLEAGLPHMNNFRNWLNRESERARQGSYAIVKDAQKYTELPRPDRLQALQDRLPEILERPEVGSFAKGIMRICDNAEALFTGQVDTLQLLMEDNVLSDIYNAHGFDMARFVKALSIVKPNLRILEVGAGTGGTTDLVLRELLRLSENPPYSKYTFTDISEGFFPQAMERFSYAPNMEYKTFNVTEDPFDQGFQPATYDLILATNVIHATPNLKSALGNLQPLLKPDGHLVLCEVCAEARAPGYVFGNFSGWWLGEADDRKWEPYVHPDRWDLELKAAGFTGADTVVIDADEPFQFSAVIISRPAPRERKRTLSAVTVLCDSPDKRTTQDVIVGLRERGLDVSVTRFGETPPPDNPILATLDAEAPFFESITEDRLCSFQNICRQDSGQKLLWLMPPAQIHCSDPRFGLTIGAMRVTRAELALPFHTLEISPSEKNYAALVMQVLTKIYERDDNDTLAPDREYAVDSGVIKIGRYQPFSLEQEVGEKGFQESKTVKSLEVGQPGRLESLQWVSTSSMPLNEDQIEIEAKAVGVNFRDIMMAMGIYATGSSNITLGLEVSGLVTRVGSNVRHVAVGDRVMGLTWEHCFSTHPVLRSPLCVRIPDNLGFEEAATMPSVYVSALQALIHVGQLQAQQTILIHSACGGVGHAAIALCKMIGAQVYITVGSEAKAQYAEETFGIPRNRIFSSRNSSFLDDLMRETHGRGVDLVLNSLAGELLHASWKCVAKFGKLVELGRRDLIGFGQLDLAPLLQNRSYCCVNVAHLMEERPDYVGRLMQEVLDLYQEGKIQPITPTAIFEASEVEQAFRYLQRGDHIGKAVVKLSADISTVSTASRSSPPRFKSDASYLLAGGLGGLGRSVATWMVENGARSLVFLSRTAGQKVDDQAFFEELKSMGCSVTATAGKAQEMADVQKAISAAPTPIKGVLHLAMVLRDAPLLDLTYDDWSEAVAPKVAGAWNLHHAFAEQELDFFIMSSSLVALVDQPGQANYAAGNCFLESFCQYRRSLGLPAAALALCPLADAGFVADNPTVQRKLKSTGFYLMPEREVLDFFHLGLLNQHSLPTDNPGGDDLLPWTSMGYLILGLCSEVHLDDPKCQAGWRRDRRMGTYHNIQDTDRNDSGATTSAIKRFLVQVADDPDLLAEQESADFLAMEIGRRILSFLMKDDSGLDISLSVTQIGVDSLMAIELRRWWKQTFGLEINVLEIMGSGTVQNLGEIAARGIRKKLTGEEPTVA